MRKTVPTRVLATGAVPTSSERVGVSAVRAAVSSLSADARAAVKTVRDSFAQGIPPLAAAGSGSVSSYVSAFSADPVGSAVVRSTARMGLQSSPAGTMVQPPRPELDTAQIIEGPGGVLDQFSVKLTISLGRAKLPAVDRIRVMRAVLPPQDAVKPAFSALTMSPAAGRLSPDATLSAARQVSQLGVANILTEFVSDSSVGSGRSITSSAARELAPPAESRNTNRNATVAGLIQVTGADRSVLENLQFFLTNGATTAPTFGETVTVGKRDGLNVLRGDRVAVASDQPVQVGNSLNFVEVGRVDPRDTSSRIVGDFVECTFLDRKVVYGSTLCYYVASIGPDGVEGPRSRLVTVPVVRSVPPATPRVFYSVAGGKPRFSILVEKGGDHVEIFRAGRAVSDSVRLATENSLLESGPALKVGEFWHLADAGLGSDGSTSFVDVTALPGDRLDYRFYSVDPYGLKSQTPFSCSITMPDHGQSVPLAIPSITAEQAVGQPSVVVRMGIDDQRVVGFYINRRELSIDERSLHQPNQPEVCDIGVFDPKRSMSRMGPMLRDFTWPGIIPIAGGSASFVDTSVRIDRKYQYAVSAVDRQGNRTPMVGSAPVAVYSKTVIDPPTAFSAAVQVSDGRPTGVLLKWTAGTNDFTPNNLVSDQDVLQAFSVRSVFQVERRTLGAPFWDALPATTGTFFFDAIDEGQTPSFRPPYVIVGEEYEYRVSAMQSGGFLSPRTDSVIVSVVPPPAPPDSVWVRASQLSVDPFVIVVSWKMRGEFVSAWEVERAAVNKLFGRRVSSINSRAVTELEYKAVASIAPESSRAHGISVDVKLDPNVYVGNRFYVDSDVSRANSYFYRVRTVGRLGERSPWTYGGVHLADDTFDQKFNSIVSDDERIALISDPRPIAKRRAL